MAMRPCPWDAATIRLNVGGRRYDVARTTLERAAYFRASQNFASASDGEHLVFVDRDGHLFKHLLSYMRTGRRPPEHVIEKYKSQLIEECCFFGLPDLELNLRGQTCDFDLRPEDRRLHAAERLGHDGLHEVFLSDCAPRDAAELQVPLLFGKGRRPELQGTSEDFCARLAAFCGRSLLAELRGLMLPGLVLAGGAVVGALTGTPAGDLDLFLTCSTWEAIAHLRAVFAAVQRSHGEAAGPTMLVTRSARAVTIYRHGTKLPAVQVVLGVSAGIREILAGFDVDCCCVAYHLESHRVLATARGLRALRYGTCLVDTEHDSSSYCRRLEKYGLRGWAIGVPGLDGLRISASLRSPHVLAQGVLLAVHDGEPCCREVCCAAHGKDETLKPSHVQRGRIVAGPARLYVMQRPVPEVQARLVFLGGDRILLLHGVPPEEPALEDEDEGCSKTHLEAAVKILERSASEGGALQKRAAGEARGGGTGPIAFVYDVAHANSSLESLACVRDAARCKGLDAKDFLEMYGLPRELRFEEGITRKTASVDWWHALYHTA